MTKLYAPGALVRSEQMRGLFGEVKAVHPQHRTGRGWSDIEYLVRNEALGLSSWIDANRITPATWYDVSAHYDKLLRETMESAIVTRDQLESWVGFDLTDEQVADIADAIPNSSIPDAVHAIATEGLGLGAEDEEF